jgi:hypothetical protein
VTEVAEKALRCEEIWCCEGGREKFCEEWERTVGDRRPRDLGAATTGEADAI